MSQALIRILLRSAAAALAPSMLSACAAYNVALGSLDGIASVFEAPSQPVPEIDLSQAKWQKLSPVQPDANPLRVAILARDEKIGATRVVLKAPPSFSLPPYWVNARATYTVLKGTFVFDALDGDGRTEKLVQLPGAFAIVPPNLIQRAATKPGDEGLLYITVYGEWAPNFADGAWAAPRLRAGS